MRQSVQGIATQVAGIDVAIQITNDAMNIVASNIEVKQFSHSKAIEDVQSSQTAVQSRLQSPEDNQVTIMENQVVLMNLICTH